MMKNMTPSERNIVKSLIAVAWADGKLEQPESGVIEGLLCGFDASEDEEAELLEYARTPRTLEAEARGSRALVLWSDPEGDLVRVEIALERCERSGRDRPDGLRGCQRRRDLSDCSKPRRRRRRG